MMKEFNLNKLCHELIVDLHDTVGDKNMLKSSLDVELPESVIGNRHEVAQAITKAIVFVSDNLINGAITIEALKKNSSGNQLNVLMQVAGSGALSRHQSLNVEEVDSYFSSFPYKLNRKIEPDSIVLEFTINLLISLQQQNGTKKLQDKRILLAEDNEINAMVFASFLEEWGCNVVVSVNGAEAVVQAHDATFDAVLMDIFMPVMKGDEATRKIREFNSTIPIIALTASNQESDFNGVLEAGANDYLLKPVSSASLLQLLSKYL